MKVLVCDDLPDRCGDVVDAIRSGESGVNITSLVADDLTTTLDSFFQEVNSCLAQTKQCQPINLPLFDSADILVLDNNLAHLGIKGARLTAEDIAGYLRAFLTAPYIVSLNKNPDVDFDLRYLVGDYATKADFALNTNHLANPALWTGSHNDSKDGFLPWYWPHLASVPARRREQISFVRDHLDDSIIDTLGFPPQALDFLSLHAKGALSPFAMTGSGNGDDGIPFDRLTFRDVFVGRSRSLPDKTELRQAISVSSTSTRPARGLRPGASMLLRSLAQISHAVLLWSPDLGHRRNHYASRYLF